MEDPSGESELEEDFPEANCGKMRWILNKGWGLGKKVLVTGLVISSAPIVLPPLVVISAIGLALSVPSGIVLASYACSENIMSKLLPYSEPPPLLENNVTLMSNNEELQHDEEWERGMWVGAKTDIEKEEGWDWTDRLEGREMRVEFVDEETGDIIEEAAQGNVTEDVGEIEFVEENGYERDVDESTDEEEKLILDSIYEVKIKGLSEDFKDDSVLDENQVDEVCGLVFNVVEGDVQMGVIPIEGTTVAIKESEGQERVNDIVEEAELVEETRGLLEKIRDEGNTDNAMEMDKRYVGESEGGGELINQKVGSNAEEIEIPVEARIADIGSQESTNTREGGVGDVPDECEGHVGDEGADYAELPVSSIACGSTDSGISSRKDVTMPSNGVLYDEAKIWGKIDAIRSIVGYKGTPHATCMEELKALYLFTGVEPLTVSFSDPPDLAQVNHKLRFLMSIIGVKLDS